MPSPTSAPTRPEELKAASLGLPAPPAINIHDWQYVLVNGDHPIEPLYYQPETLAYLNMVGDDTDIRTDYDPNRQMVDISIAQPLIDMVQACKAAGLPVYLSSGFRDYGSQQANFDRVCANNGISDGKNAEGNYITMPAGCSEHQTRGPHGPVAGAALRGIRLYSPLPDGEAGHHPRDGRVLAFPLRGPGGGALHDGQQPLPGGVCRPVQRGVRSLPI